MTKPFPNFGAQLANTLRLLHQLHHPDAEALIARHLEKVERPEPPAQPSLLKEACGPHQDR